MIEYHSLKSISNALKTKKISSVELVKYYLDRIFKYNKTLNCFITITYNHALKQAEYADKKIADGKANILTGIPIAHKDLICTKGIKTTCASKMLKNFISPYDAHIVKLCKKSGLVLLGKTNLDEFAMGSSNESSYFGPCKNPWDLSRIPGGSSGGSAAAISANLTPIATGTDTGGSIRQPASMCNITGLKPTYGLVSRYGIIAYASSLDQAGPMGNSAEDCALLLNIISGYDKKDSTSSLEHKKDFTKILNNSIKGIKIGIPEDYFSKGLDPKIELTIQHALKKYESMGAKLKSIRMKHNDICISAYYIIAQAEASSNLAKYDGIRFGYRCQNPKNLWDLYERSRGEGFGEIVKQRILAGTFMLSSEFYNSYYIKAQKIRRLIFQDFQKAFEKVDVIMGPTSPILPYKIGKNKNDLSLLYLSDMYTLSLNMAGLPGITIPAGFVKKLPIGLQIISPAFTEEKLLNIAHQFQLNTDWHMQKPQNIL